MLVILRQHARCVAFVNFIHASSAVQVVLSLTLLFFQDCMCQAALQSNWLQQCCLIADSGSERNRRQGSLLLNCNGRCGCQGCAAVCLFGNEPRVCEHGKNSNAVIAYFVCCPCCYVALQPITCCAPLVLCTHVIRISAEIFSYQFASNFSTGQTCCGQHC